MTNPPDWIKNYHSIIEKNRKLFYEKTARPFVTKDASRKFFADGKAKPFHGWSLVHFFGHEYELNNSLINAKEHLLSHIQSAGIAEKFAFLPQSTYHMTLVGITTNQPVSIQREIIEGVKDAVSLFKKEKIQSPRIRIRGDISPDGSTLIVPIEPMDKQSLDTIYFIRNEVRKRLHPLGYGMVRNSPQNFHGHISLAYIINPLSVEDYKKLKEILKMFENSDQIGSSELTTISLHRFESMIDWGNSIVDLKL